MQGLRLVIGDKKHWPWSLRPWIAMKGERSDFEVKLSPFDIATMHAHYWAFSPTEKLPVFVHEEQTIWDSLAILRN